MREPKATAKLVAVGAALIATVLASGVWAALPFPADTPPATVTNLGEASGLVWHPGRQKLYAVSDGGTLWSFNDDGSQLVGWGGLNDIEGVTYADPGSNFVYVVRERPSNAILEFDIVAGSVRRTFDLTPWIHPADPNQGAEAITFVPESASVEGGYFYVGAQEDGIVRLFELPLVSNPLSSTVTLIGSFSPRPGRTDISDMDFDRQHRILYVLWDNADRLAAYRDDNTLLREWEMYDDSAPNQEGIAVDPAGRRLFSCEDDSDEVYLYTGFDFEADRLPLEIGDGWRYFKGTQAPPSNWRSIGFDDSGWLAGPSGFGYGPDCDTERGTTLPDMRNGYVSLYARHPLRIDDPARVVSLTLIVDYDDALVAYLNGVEVARNNVTGNPPAHTQVAASNHECSDGLPANPPGTFVLSTGSLIAGSNVLAIQGHNQALSSSDFTLTMSLSGVELPGCTTDPDCDDGLPCNGAEVCSGTVCMAGSPQPDTDGDGACDLADVCPDVPDPAQTNSDGDARGNACDCAPTDAQNWQMPGEVVGLLLAHSGGVSGTTTLSWQPPTNPGAATVAYDTIRSTTAAGFDNPGSASCVETDDGSDAVAHDPVTPASDSVRCFLVRAQNGCGHGALGSRSSGEPRLAIACP